MRGLILAACLLLTGLTGCATVTAAPSVPLERSSFDVSSGSPLIQRHSDEVAFVFDSRLLRALRDVDGMSNGLGLTRGQKVALWTSVAVVGAYVLAEWLEDNVAFFPE